MNLKDVLAAKGHRVVTVPARSSVADAIRAMNAENVGSVMVPDAEGCPVGIFTERDVVRLYAEGEREFETLALEARIARLIHDSHAAFPELVEDLVVQQRTPDQRIGYSGVQTIASRWCFRPSGREAHKTTRVPLLSTL